MKTGYILLGALGLLILAGCPDGSSGDSGEDGEPVYRVSVGALQGGSIRIKPDSGPEGTEILVQVTADEGWYFVPGSLGYDDGTGATPIDEEVMRFMLPASDISVGASFLNTGELSRRMVRVAGATVNKNTGFSGHPFAGAGANPVEVKGFRIGAVEIPYDLWYTVKHWAEDTKEEPTYTFDHVGQEGTQYKNFDKPPTAEHRYEPALFMEWRVAVVWCNAYSEWDREVNGASREAVYKTAGGVVIRNSRGSGWTNPEEPSFDAPGYRLPTEAEWEFAARGGDPAAEAWDFLYAGGNNQGDVAWYLGNSGRNAHAVGLKLPNTLGLYDMSGNGLEWCWDLFSGSSRVIRGGSCRDSVVPITARNASASSSADLIGFRVVAPLD